MEKLFEILEEYNKLISWGHNKLDAAKTAVNKSGLDNYIYQNKDEEPSHIFNGGFMLMFEEGIYKKVTI